MRNALLSLSLSAAALLGGAVTGFANATGTDGVLRSAVESRRDSLSEATDALGKKQYKTTLKVLKLMDKPSKDLAGDAKSAGKIAKLLQKAFPDDFTSVGAGGTFREVVTFLFEDLQGIVEEDLGDLEGSLGGLSSKGQAKVTAGLGKADAALEAVDTADLPLWAKLIVKAYKEWVKGQKVIEKDKGPTVGVSITVNGKAFKPGSDTTVVVLNEIPGLLVFTATKVGLPALTLSVTPGAVLSTGEKGISIASWNELGLPSKNYQADSGTFNVTALDMEANTISFSFSFTASGVLGTTGTVNVQGTYSGPYQSGS